MSAVRTGFIGLGQQGGPIAQAIGDAGFSLCVWARSSEATAPFQAKGASAASSVAELGAACDHVGVCVVDDAGVAEVCVQLILAMRAGSLLAIHSTMAPQSCEQLAEQCKSRGILFLNAPVSGGGPAATTKALTVMCGGTDEAFARARPVLESFAGLLLHLGGAGAGQRAKLVNNALMAANMGLAHAALHAGEALGIARDALAELIKQSSGRSFGFEVYARLPAPQAFAHGAPLLTKDVALLQQALQPNADADVLAHAARHFLKPATQQK
jgi:3-hydroxyisobutyrate dehydrogenase-like beta-hydroxyacid dehydrogenase